MRLLQKWSQRPKVTIEKKTSKPPRRKTLTQYAASITLSAARSRTTKSPYTGNKADIPRDALITTTGIIIPLIVLFLGWLCYRRYHKKKDQKAEGRSNTALLSTSKSKSNGPFDRKWWKKHGRAIAEQNQTSENPKDGTLQALASAKSSDYFTSNDEDPEAQPANDH